MKNKNKKLIILLVILILIVVVIINIFSKIVTKNVEKDNQENKNQYKDEQISIGYEQKGKYEPSVINSEYKRLSEKQVLELENTIDYMINLINKKSYSELFAMTTFEYRDMKFYNEEMFKEYIDKIFEKDDYECATFKVQDGACYLSLVSASDTTKNDYKKIKIDNFKNNNNLNIFFEDIISVEEAITSNRFSSVSINMCYIVRYENKVSAFIRLSNKNNKNVEIDFEDFKFYTVNNGVESEFEATKGEKITLGPKESTEVEIFFNNDEITFYAPHTIQYTVNINGEKYTKKVIIKYAEFE